MRHLLLMAVFAALVAVVFGTLTRDTQKARILYGIKVFAEFMGIGLVLALILYFIPGT